MQRVCCFPTHCKDDEPSINTEIANPDCPEIFEQNPLPMSERIPPPPPPITTCCTRSQTLTVPKRRTAKRRLYTHTDIFHDVVHNAMTCQRSTEVLGTGACGPKMEEHPDQEPGAHQKESFIKTPTMNMKVRERGSVKMLRELRANGLLAVKENEWEEIVMTVDSGASETVAPPDVASGIPITDSPASLRGAMYEVANGEVITNKGEKRCVIQCEEGTAKLMNIQVCDVHKPLLAVSKLCDSGHAVVFHPTWSYIEHLATGERTTLDKKDGVYELRAWVKRAPGTQQQDFQRQGGM